MDEYVQSTNPDSATAYLSVQLIQEAAEVVRRQKDKTFFLSSGEESEETAALMANAPLSNGGCESRVAAAGNLMKASGGNASIEYLSHKTVIASNPNPFQNLSEAEMNKEWEFAQKSDQANEAKQHISDFMSRWKASENLPTKPKLILKRQKRLCIRPSG
jgi:4-aminobutyrate aminotransferase-like enzyme